MCRDYPDIEYCPHCYHARGVEAVKARQARLTDPATFEEYGNGAWPLKTVYDRGEMAVNGNYLEVCCCNLSASLLLHAFISYS